MTSLPGNIENFYAHSYLAGDEVKFGETHLFLGPRFLVTVRHGYSRSHSKISKRCEAMPKQLTKGPGFAFYSIMDFIVHNYVLIDLYAANFRLPLPFLPFYLQNLLNLLKAT
jgi:Mg2+ and Co2+ transporter CorA